MKSNVLNIDYLPFEPNAKNIDREELVKTFVPTQAFLSLLEKGHHIILGSRGSGKTAIAKMLSHHYLSIWDDKLAKEILNEKKFIGTYVPVRLSWVSALKNKPWQTEQEKEELFQWRINLATCLSLIGTIKSCLEYYFSDPLKRYTLEDEITAKLSDSWCDKESGVSFTSLSALRKYLEDLDWAKQQQIARWRTHKAFKDKELSLGMSFDTGVFEPMMRGIRLANRILEFPQTTNWFLCLDEAETLDRDHHRILNSQMRASSLNDVFFKITTTPYSHKTRETNLDPNQKISLIPGQDFKYVYIDMDRVAFSGQKGEEEVTFASMLFDKLAKTKPDFTHINLNNMLGTSRLLDRKMNRSWRPSSRNMKLLRKFSTEDTIARAERVLKKVGLASFSDQIGRKIHPALLLREAITNLKGGRRGLDIYSGVAMVVRCGDENPRRLIKIFNLFLQSISSRTKSGKLPILSPFQQTRILEAASLSELSSVQSEDYVGPELHMFLKNVGAYMRHMLHDERLTTDQITSITIDRTMLQEMADEYKNEDHWDYVRRSVALGLLYPNVSANNPDPLPHSDGKFHLAYILSPHFQLLPRRGHARKLSTIIRWAKSNESNKFVKGVEDETI